MNTKNDTSKTELDLAAELSKHSITVDVDGYTVAFTFKDQNDTFKDQNEKKELIARLFHLNPYIDGNNFVFEDRDVEEKVLEYLFGPELRIESDNANDKARNDRRLKRKQSKRKRHHKKW